MRRGIGWATIVAMALLSFGALAAPAAADPTTRLVGTSSCQFGNPQYSTIGAAVAAANSGDSIVVCPATYHERVNDQGKMLHFNGGDSPTAPGVPAGSSATVNGDGGTAFTFTGGSTLTHFRITGATDTARTPALLSTLTVSKPNLFGADNNLFFGNRVAACFKGIAQPFGANKVIAPTGGGAGVVIDATGSSRPQIDNNAFQGKF